MTAQVQNYPPREYYDGGHRPHGAPEYGPYYTTSPRYAPPAHHVQSHHAAQRYDPYRRPPHQPQPQPRLLPAHNSHPYPHSSPPQHHHHTAYNPSHHPDPRAKAYETTRPTGRYQQSRGAQRDAKWHARYAERAHLISHAAVAQTDRISPPHLGLHIPSSSPMPSMDRIRQEQQAAIAGARRAHAETLEREAAKEEAERKVRRIQLQVFVHARSTSCLWEGCEAVLNSWALLEKHLDHCHLHARVKPRGDSDKVECRWEGCKDVFDNAEDCYQHCLIGHMGGFSARCPFDCLFEGPRFPDLMAHIGRRHPVSTPEDFVPGLIHHRPAFLPPLNKLPQLPSLARIHPNGDLDEPFPGGLIKPYPAEPGNKVKKLIARGSFSGRRPRKEDYADKRGASAAISAVIENSRRISEMNSHEELEEEGAQPPPPKSAVSATVTTKEAVDAGVDLVDVKKLARDAKEIAKKEAANDVVTEDSSSDSVSGSRPPSRSGLRPMLKVRLTSSLGNGDVRSNVGGGSEEDASSDTSSSSRYSEYKASRSVVISSPAAEGESGIKRSARLKMKTAGSDSVMNSPEEGSVHVPDVK